MELYYVGLRPSAGPDIENVKRAEEQIKDGISRTTVVGRVRDTIAGTATGDPNSAFVSKNDVTQWDQEFATVEYYQTQDALLTPVNAKPVGTATTPNGVASLVSGTIPASQVPTMGVGILKGPLPITTAYNGNTFDVPLKIAEWQIGVTAMACIPWAFMTASVLSNGGLPVIEIRCGDPSQTTYASQLLVAQGYGRSHYHDWQTVPVYPTDPALNKGQAVVPPNLFVKHAFFPVNFNMVLTAWLYDDAQGIAHQSVETQAAFLSGSAYLAKMSY